MHPNFLRILALARVMLIGQTGMDQGQATLVRDGKGPPALPAIESGGHRLTHNQPPTIPYSLIGAISSGLQ